MICPKIHYLIFKSNFFFIEKSQNVCYFHLYRRSSATFLRFVLFEIMTLPQPIYSSISVYSYSVNLRMLTVYCTCFETLWIIPVSTWYSSLSFWIFMSWFWIFFLSLSFCVLSLWRHIKMRVIAYHNQNEKTSDIHMQSHKLHVFPMLMSSKEKKEKQKHTQNEDKW